MNTADAITGKVNVDLDHAFEGTYPSKSIAWVMLSDALAEHGIDLEPYTPEDVEGVNGRVDLECSEGYVSLSWSRSPEGYSFTAEYHG